MKASALSLEATVFLLTYSLDAHTDPPSVYRAQGKAAVTKNLLRIDHEHFSFRIQGLDSKLTGVENPVSSTTF